MFIFYRCATIGCYVEVKLISSNILPYQASFLLNVVFYFFMYGALYAESVLHTLAVKCELVLWLR